MYKYVRIQILFPNKWLKILKAEAKLKYNNEFYFSKIIREYLSQADKKFNFLESELEYNKMEKEKENKNKERKKRQDLVYANICKKCNKPFPNRITIDNKLCLLYGRKFCLECSPYGKHNTVNFLKDKTKKICPLCKKELPRECFSNRRTKNDKIIAASYCKTCTRSFVREKENLLKEEAVKYKGGECQVCHYKRCLKNLHFHHVDPTNKNFSISKSRKIKFEDIKEELDKCVLVCSICHVEIENGLIPCPPILPPQPLH